MLAKGSVGAKKGQGYTPGGVFSCVVAALSGNNWQSVRVMQQGRPEGSGVSLGLLTFSEAIRSTDIAVGGGQNGFRLRSGYFDSGWPNQRVFVEGGKRRALRRVLGRCPLPAATPAARARTIFLGLYCIRADLLFRFVIDVLENRGGGMCPHSI